MELVAVGLNSQDRRLLAVVDQEVEVWRRSRIKALVVEARCGSTVAAAGGENAQNTVHPSAPAPTGHRSDSRSRTHPSVRLAPPRFGTGFIEQVENRMNGARDLAAVVSM